MNENMFWVLRSTGAFRRIFPILCKESVSLYIGVKENWFSQVNLYMKTYVVGV